MEVCDNAGEKIGGVAGVHRRGDGAAAERVIEVKTGFLGLGTASLTGRLTSDATPHPRRCVVRARWWPARARRPGGGVVSANRAVATVPYP
jgi:hypothetical protein